MNVTTAIVVLKDEWQSVKSDYYEVCRTFDDQTINDQDMQIDEVNLRKQGSNGNENTSLRRGRSNVKFSTMGINKYQ
jgi:hypothetical protein